MIGASRQKNNRFLIAVVTIACIYGFITLMMQFKSDWRQEASLTRDQLPRDQLPQKQREGEINSVSIVCGNAPIDSSERIEATGCASEGEYLALMRADEPNRHWLVVDVGVNKGYVLGSCLMALGASEKVMKEIEREAVAYAKIGAPERKNEPPLCGTCENCKEKRATVGDASPVAGARLVGFDIVSANTDFLRQLMGSKTFTDLVPFPFHTEIFLAGVSEVALSNISVCRQQFGFTRGSLNARGCTTAVESIRSTTLDTEFPHDVIDYLVIDAEGFDYVVAAGARKKLEKGEIRMMQIELHGENIRFKEFVRRMHAFGYVTFLIVAGNKRDLLEVSGPCWSSLFDAQGWQNALSVHRNEKALLLRLRERSGRKKNSTFRRS